MKQINLDFDGFWIERKMEKLPQQAGIYVVYEGAYDEEGKSVHLEKIVYVGKSDNFAAQINGHEKFGAWKEECGESNELFFACAPIEGEDREIAFAALIYEQEPPVNEQYKDVFPFEDTEIELSGKTGLLVTTFEVVTELAVVEDDDDEGPKKGC